MFDAWFRFFVEMMRCGPRLIQSIILFGNLRIESGVAIVFSSRGSGCKNEVDFFIFVLGG